MKIIIEVNPEQTGYGIDILSTGKNPKSTTYLTSAKISPIVLAHNVGAEVTRMLLEGYL